MKTGTKPKKIKMYTPFDLSDEYKFFKVYFKILTNITNGFWDNVLSDKIEINDFIKKAKTLILKLDNSKPMLKRYRLILFELKKGLNKFEVKYKRYSIKEDEFRHFSDSFYKPLMTYKETLIKNVENLQKNNNEKLIDYQKNLMIRQKKIKEVFNGITEEYMILKKRYDILLEEFLKV